MCALGRCTGDYFTEGDLKEVELIHSRLFFDSFHLRSLLYELTTLNFL